jgi:hypothetical protein
LFNHGKRHLYSAPTSVGSSRSSSSASNNTTYTPSELVVIFLEIYTILATLHYDAADLKVPPPEGWPELMPEHCAGFKSDFAI